MAKASGTIDLKAMKEGHDDASTKATNYITEDETGINIHNTNDSYNYTHILLKLVLLIIQHQRPHL